VSRRSLAAGSAVGFAAGWNIADTGAVADELGADYGIGLATVGLFTTALFVTHMLFQVPAGRLSDRLGPMQVCAAGVVVLGCCNALALVAAEPWIVLLARTAMGAGTALAFIGGSDYVRATGGSPFAQGLYGGIATAGGGAALAVVPALVGPLGWRAPFSSAIAVAAAAGILLAAGPTVRAAPGLVGARTPMRALASDPTLLRLAVLFAASFGLSVVVGNWVVTLVEETTALSGVAAGAVGAATLALGIVSRPLGGWVFRGHPARMGQAIVASALLGASGVAALTSGSVALALAGSCVVGLAAGIPFSACFTRAAALHAGSPAAAIGLVNAAGALTVLVGTPLVGAAFARDADTAAFIVMGVLWVASLLALPGALSPAARRLPAG
jgi:NNP family nitrate/nitrite transporter-like MFS transporter